MTPGPIDLLDGAWSAIKGLIYGAANAASRFGGGVCRDVFHGFVRGIAERRALVRSWQKSEVRDALQDSIPAFVLIIAVLWMVLQ